MKTKEVVIEGWANVYGNDKYYGSKFCAHIHESEEKAALNYNKFSNYKYSQVKCKLILEVPEKTVTISESDLAEAWKNSCVVKPDESRIFRDIKKNLFGEGE